MSGIHQSALPPPSPCILSQADTKCHHFCPRNHSHLAPEFTLPEGGKLLNYHSSQTCFSADSPLIPVHCLYHLHSSPKKWIRSCYCFPLLFSMAPYLPHKALHGLVPTHTPLIWTPLLSCCIHSLTWTCCHCSMLLSSCPHLFWLYSCQSLNIGLPWNFLYYLN